MKYIFGIFLALIIAGGAYAESATVVEIVDGDTFLATISDGTEIGDLQKVHFANANAPEFPAKCSAVKQVAQQAKERTTALLPLGTVVELKNVKADEHHKRMEANVVLSDGRDVGEILIREKLAYADRKQSWCPKKKGVPASSIQKKAKNKSK